MFTAIFSELRVCLSAPDLNDISIEETLHRIDCTTPPSLIYDDLVPRTFQISMGGLKIFQDDFKRSEERRVGKECSS